MDSTIHGERTIRGKRIWLVSSFSYGLQKEEWKIVYEDCEDVPYDSAEAATIAFQTLELDEALKE